LLAFAAVTEANAHTANTKIDSSAATLRPRINATPARRDLVPTRSPPVNSGGGGSAAG